MPRITITATQLRQKKGYWLKRAEHEPVYVAKYGKPHVTLLSYEYFLRIKRLADEGEPKVSTVN
ncbi:MAG: hypothetical protein R3E18_12045 [Sphingomonadaceae bacterium]